MNKQRNEAKLSEELKGMRESRKDLRDFEHNMDKDLPSLKKIKEFNELAREVIDNSSRAKLGGMINRSQSEEEQLSEKIRQLQKENPDKDYTQLFETERAELARKSQHKKAFASYKAFQFLKHGVELQSRGVQAATPAAEKKIPAPYKTKDPYAFEPVQKIVDLLMNTNEKFPRVLDSGDALDQQPGRKFGYTEEDFLLAYFGKDSARNASLEFSQNNVFGFNDSYKKKFPIDKYEQGPSIEAQRRLVEERIGLERDDVNAFISTLETENVDYVKDTPHPSDKSRTLIKDSQSRIENYLKRKEKQTGVEMWNTREVGGIRKSIREEYFPTPKKPVVSDDVVVKDTKTEEKFEPFYDGETAPGNTADEPAV